MAKILIVYTTSIGNNKKMAETVADGAKSVETAVTLKSSYEATTTRSCRNVYSKLNDFCLINS